MGPMGGGTRALVRRRLKELAIRGSEGSAGVGVWLLRPTGSPATPMASSSSWVTSPGSWGWAMASAARLQWSEP
jgi:hypothetical protein